ncbi:MAG: sensor histidine kinase [Actinomycetota bacterium]
MTEELRFAQLISTVAHELRSPLTSIKGFSATLVKRWDRFGDEQRRQFVETIHDDAERMNRIVTEVLDLARLEAKRIEYRVTPCDLGEVVKGASDRLVKRPGHDRLAIEVPEGLEVRADCERVRRVLENVIENALKFSDEEPVQVTAAEVSGAVEIKVEDRGVGIEPERVGEVFEGPGPQGQQATPTGSGLGLYLAKRLLDGQGGSISVESRPGEGSTFTIRLPSQGAV